MRQKSQVKTGDKNHLSDSTLDKMMNGRKSKKDEAAANDDRLHASLFALCDNDKRMSDCSSEDIRQ
jgi:hypothetical protein